MANSGDVRAVTNSLNDVNNEINNLLNQILVNNEDPLKGVRENIIKQDLKRLNGGVSKFITQYIEKICGIEGES